jgi:transposase
MAARKKNQAKGKSKGGWTSKIHALVDAKGRLLRGILTPGNANDCPQAQELIGSWRPKALLGDKGYDSEPLRKWLRAKRIRPVIPGKSNRRKKIRHDKELYKERNVVDRWFGWIKEWRCVALRCEKLDRCFALGLLLVGAIHWLKTP